MSWYNPFTWADGDDGRIKDDNELLYGSASDSGLEQGSPGGNGQPWGKQDLGTSWERDSPEAMHERGLAQHDDNLKSGYTSGGSDARDYMYGRTAGGADAASGMALTTGANAQLHGQATEGADRDLSQQVQYRAAPQGNWAAQNGALANASGYGGQLAGLEATQGPSAAQAQLQAGTNQAMAGQIALARSGRGFGGNAAAAGLAQTNLAGLQAGQANSSAMLAAQENAAWRGRQASNLGNAGALQAQIGQQYGTQGQADLNAKLAGQGQNDAAALGWAGQGQQAWQGGVGANFAGQGQADTIRGRELGAGASFEDNQLRHWAAQNGFNLQQEGMNNQKDAANTSAAATFGGALLASDIRGKTNIVPSDKAASDFARGLDYDGTIYRPRQLVGHEVGAPYTPAEPTHGAAPQAEPPMTPMQQQFLGKFGGGGDGGQSGTPAATAPVHQFAPGARPDTSKAFDTETLDASALDAVRNSPASFYDYKDPSAPGADAQQHYGPMAQDLAKTPAGRSAVTEMPDGRLGVDTGRLALVHNGAISAQQKQLDAIQAQLDAFAKKPTAVQPNAVYGGR